jgi:hypothetical protein
MLSILEIYEPMATFEVKDHSSHDKGNDMWGKHGHSRHDGPKVKHLNVDGNQMKLKCCTHGNTFNHLQRKIWPSIVKPKQNAI